MSGAEVIPLLIAGTAVSAVGTVVSGIQQKKAADFNADVAKNKAKYDEGIHRERVKRLLSEQRSVIGKSGVEFSGSPLLATIDTIEKGELDALAIRQGGEVSAQISKQKGKNALIGSAFKAGSTLLTGASKFKRPTVSPGRIK